MSRRKLSKTQRLLNHMLRGRTINGHQALRTFGIYRLSAIIFSFRKKGFDIETKMTKRAGYTYATYTLKHVPNMDGKNAQTYQRKQAS